MNIFPRILWQYFFPSLPTMFTNSSESTIFCGLLIFLAVTGQFLDFCKKDTAQLKSVVSLQPPLSHVHDTGTVCYGNYSAYHSPDIQKNVGAFLRTGRYMKLPAYWLLCTHLKYNQGHSFPKNTVFVHPFL